MSGKAKTAEKGQVKADRGPNDMGFKHVRPSITRLLEFRKNDRGNLVPKLRWEREA